MWRGHKKRPPESCNIHNPEVSYRLFVFDVPFGDVVLHNRLDDILVKKLRAVGTLALASQGKECILFCFLPVYLLSTCTFPKLKYVGVIVRPRTPLTQAGWWKGSRAQTMEPGLRPHSVPLTRLLNFSPVFLAISKAFPIFRNCL